ncbi:MAG: toll/interleukin-1 receptor domain-containing protein [Actinobacteria bacterium]|nr:toll/interleukin-1 receptor domain-containing protein [Actinomycetota bacterium]
MFISHLALRKDEVHELARMLNAFGFACFVAHEAIEPSRSWQREIERALRSCDLLVAYITPGFTKSKWTDQEVGWALGRELIAIPISVDGQDPYGFIGTYQAVKYRKDMTAAGLSRVILRAVVDAVFVGQRPAVDRLVQEIPSIVVSALCKARSRQTAELFFGVLLKMPTSSWSAQLRQMLRQALQENGALHDCRIDGRTISDHLSGLSSESR